MKIETDIKEYSDNETVYFEGSTKKPLLMVGNKDLDLKDILNWVKKTKPHLLKD